MAPRTEIGILRKHGVVKKYGKKIDRSKITASIQAEIDALTASIYTKPVLATALAPAVTTATLVKTKKAKSMKDTNSAAPPPPDAPAKPVVIAKSAAPNPVPQNKNKVDQAPVVNVTAKAPTAAVVNELVDKVHNVQVKRKPKKHGLDNQSSGVEAVKETPVAALMPAAKKRRTAFKTPADAKKQANLESTTTLEQGNWQQEQVYKNTLVSIQPVYNKDDIAKDFVSNALPIGVPVRGPTSIKARVDTDEAKVIYADRDEDFGAALHKAEATKKKNAAYYRNRLANTERMAIDQDLKVAKKWGGRANAA